MVLTEEIVELLLQITNFQVIIVTVLHTPKFRRDYFPGPDSISYRRTGIRRNSFLAACQ